MRVAWLWRTVSLLLAGSALAWAWLCARAGHPLVGLAGALLIGGVHAPLMAVEAIVLHRVNRRDPAPAPTAAERLRAWAAEVVGAVVVFGWRQSWRWAQHPDSAGAPGQRGVVLVHGFVCNRGLWHPWRARLQAAGVPVIALNLEPVFGPIDGYAPAIDAAVQRIAQATGRPPLLVGHSMGGLAIRAWLRASGADARVHGVVTIGTPHHGTWTAARIGRLPLANARQMRLDNAWLRALAAAEPAARRARFTCFYSHCDNIVFPASSATLPGADNRHLRGRAHVHLLRDPAVLAEVLRRLRD